MFDKHKGKKQSHNRDNEPGLIQPSGAASSASVSAPGKPAVIGAGIIINGDISGTENLIIEGKIKGHVHLASHDVTIGRSGELNADVKAKIIRVAGKVQGDLVGKEKSLLTVPGMFVAISWHREWCWKKGRSSRA